MEWLSGAGGGGQRRKELEGGLGIGFSFWGRSFDGLRMTRFLGGRLKGHLVGGRGLILRRAQDDRIGQSRSAWRCSEERHLESDGEGPPSLPLRNGVAVVGPVFEEGGDDEAADAVVGFEGGEVARGVGEVIEEVFSGVDAGGRDGEVAGGAEDEEALVVDVAEAGELGHGEAEGLVFAIGHDEGAGAVGVEADPILGPVVHDGAGPEAVGAEAGALEDGGWGLGHGLILVERAAGGHRRVVGDFHVFGELVGPADEGGIELEGGLADIARAAAGDAGDADGVGIGRNLVGRGGTESDDAVGPGGGGFTAVDFEGGIAIDHLLDPGRTAEGAGFGIDPGDAAEKEVGFAEIELGVHGEGHHLDGAAGGGAADHGIEAGAVGENGVIDPGDLDGLGEVFAFDPVLKFAGGVAGVLADFVGGDDHDLGLNDGGGVDRGRGEGESKESRETEEPRGDRDGRGRKHMAREQVMYQRGGSAEEGFSGRDLRDCPGCGENRGG
jgi:hypothetical protein